MKTRAIDSEGNKISTQTARLSELYRRRGQKLSYMKFLYKISGKEKAGIEWTSRLNTPRCIPTPLAQREFEIYKAYKRQAQPFYNAYTLGKADEILHAAEMMKIPSLFILTRRVQICEKERGQ